MLPRLRHGLLADISERIRREREREPLIAHEVTLMINVAELRKDPSPRMLATAARALDAAAAARKRLARRLSRRGQPAKASAPGGGSALEGDPQLLTDRTGVDLGESVFVEQLAQRGALVRIPFDARRSCSTRPANQINPAAPIFGAQSGGRSALQADEIVGRAIWLLLLSPERFCSSFNPCQRLSHSRGESRMVTDIIVS